VDRHCELKDGAAFEPDWGHYELYGISPLRITALTSHRSSSPVMRRATAIGNAMTTTGRPGICSASLVRRRSSDTHLVRESLERLRHQHDGNLETQLEKFPQLRFNAHVGKHAGQE
jgi:hypothetical protein